MYDGELCFFAVDSSCRGKGVGKELFLKALKYMENESIENFYLYTDSSCNYKLYEIQGMTRRGEKTCSVPLDLKNEMLFYLYDYQMNKN